MCPEVDKANCLPPFKCTTATGRWSEWYQTEEQQEPLGITGTVQTQTGAPAPAAELSGPCLGSTGGLWSRTSINAVNNSLNASAATGEEEKRCLIQTPIDYISSSVLWSPMRASIARALHRSARPSSYRMNGICKRLFWTAVEIHKTTAVQCSTGATRTHESQNIPCASVK